MIDVNVPEFLEERSEPYQRLLDDAHGLGEGEPLHRGEKQGDPLNKHPELFEIRILECIQIMHVH